MSSRQSKIQNYIHELTEKIIFENLFEEICGADASNCSLDLHLDRANVSKEMNTLWKNGDLIKIHGRPVYYLDYQSLITHYPDSFFPSIINKSESITNYLKSTGKQRIQNTPDIKIESLDNMIGADGTLSDVILNARSACSYPPNGIPCLITGNTGVGKTMLASRMFDYICQQRNKTVPFVTLYCQNYENNSSLFTDVLLGNDHKGNQKSKQSIFEQCEDGIILFEQIEHLPYSSQNLLATILKKKMYQPSSSPSLLPLNAMVIITSSLSDTNPEISAITNAVPVHLHLLDIDQRGVYEKLELIMSLLQQEALDTGISIKVHKDIITLFAMQKYPNNISDLRNEIQIACSKAFLNTSVKKNSSIYLTYQCLSLNMLNNSQESSTNNARIISLLSCIPINYLQFNSDGTSTASEIFSNAPSVFKEHRISQFIDEFKIDINDLDNIESYVNENINVLKDCPDAQLQGLRNAINPYVMQVTLRKLQERKKYKLLKNEYQLLYGILLHITNYLKRIPYSQKSQEMNETSITDKIYPEEYSLANDIYTSFGQTYSFSPSPREIDFLASYLAIANQWAKRTTVSILVICHGSSIATQLVNYVKSSIKGNYSIDAINYDENMQLNDCLELACLKASTLNKGVGVLIACDMEPLTSIGDHVFRQTGIPSRTISNVTLSSLITLVQQSMSAINDIDSLASGMKDIEPQPSNSPKNSFIEQIRTRIIDKTVSFINTQKAVDVLQTCLNNTLHELSIPYSDAIAVKYICHCTNMLERIIKNECWEYPKIKHFYEENTYLIHVIEHNLEYAGNSFSIKIPVTELAYVSEIFLFEIKGEN